MRLPGRLVQRNGAFGMDELGNVQDGSGNVLQIFAPGADPLVDAPIDAQVPLTNGAGALFAGLTVSIDGKLVASYADGTNTTIAA